MRIGCAFQQPRLSCTTRAFDCRKPGGVDGSELPGDGRPDRHRMGRIWDTLPNSFPEIPGARPSEEAGTGPASATFVIAGDVARLVATALVTQMASAGFPTEGLGTPLEDASYTLEAPGPPRAARSS